MNSIKSITQTQYSRFWILLALFCLFYSGAIALAITFAKLPVVGDYLENVDIIRWSLVIHVNLATIVWFTAFPIGLIYKQLSIKSLKVSLFQVIGAIVAALGVVLIISDFPDQNLIIHMSNYVPVLDSKQFLIGIFIYLIGSGISYFYILSLKRIKEDKKYLVGTIFFIFSLVTLIFSCIDLLNHQIDFQYYEYLWWGFGHLLQHASTAFCVVCWCLLLKNINKNLNSNLNTNISFFLLFLPILFVPFIILEPSSTDQYRNHFTKLMQYGIFPGVLYYIFSHLYRLSNLKNSLSDYRAIALLFSILLMIIGFIFGAFIRGPDLRVPAHYHAVIGAVTLSFMVVCYEFFIEKKLNVNWMKYCVYIFTLGQIIFSSALFVAGIFGYERKTYAAENAVTTVGQNIVFILMPIGGLMAFIGGVCFAVAIIKDRKYLR